jgi:membrane protein
MGRNFGAWMIWRLLTSTVNAWLDDYAPSMGAALAFYTLFSIAPLLLIVISVTGFFFGEAAARAEIFAQISLMVGEDSATTLDTVLKSLDKPAASLLGMLVGLGTLLIGATTVFVELQNAMARIWQVPLRPDFSGVRDFFRVRLLSLGLVLGIGFLLLVSLVLSALMAALGKWWAPWFGEFALVADAVNFVVTLTFITAVFAMIYKWMPRTAVAWRDVWIGALITALLFTVGKTLIGLYIGRSAVASVFGAASSLVVLLLWVYYSAQVFLLGAEFTWVFAQRRKPAPSPPAPDIPQRPD